MKALRNALVRMLCFTVAWMTVVPAIAHAESKPALSEQELLAANPNARIIHVSEAEYPQLAERLRRQGYRQSNIAEPLYVAQNDSYSTSAYNAENGAYSDPRRDRARCDGEAAPEDGTAEVHGSANLHLDLGNGSGGNGDGAVVLFIIIGTVVVVVWTLYLFKYLYDVSLGYQPCRWSEMGFSSTAISTNALQHAYFNGFTFQTGVQDGITEFGLSGEVGNADIQLVENGLLHLQGLYWLLGPTLRWRLSSGENPHYFQMQFMAGTTENAEMGVLGKADLSLHLALSDRINLGLSWGAIHMNLHENDGIITNRDQYFYLYGISAGVRF